jgi:hypothetical protein
MKPYLRPTDKPQLAPVGWVAERVGQWRDGGIDAVYDPDRHDVLYIDTRTTIPLRVSFTKAGYRMASTDGHQELWVRDRADAACAALARIDRATEIRSGGTDLPSPA